MRKYALVFPYFCFLVRCSFVESVHHQHVYIVSSISGVMHSILD